MSSARTRPTRAETRERLFEAAAEVFERQGIAGASVEDIAAAAGFSRGAFYSNFANKDELVLAMLDNHIEVATIAVEALFEASADPGAFVASLGEVFTSRRSPIDRSPVLFMEFLLHAARNPANRPRLAEATERMRQATAEINRRSAEQLGLVSAIEPDDAAAAVVALDYGYSLLFMLDPERYPTGCFAQTVSDLQSLWVEASRPR